MSAFIDEYRARFGIEPICRELEVSASAYRARRRRPPSARAVRDAVVLGEICRVHAEAFEIYGQWKTWQQLQREGIRVARCTVERLMREHGIEGVRKRKTRRTTIPGLAPVPAVDLVRRDFTASCPDQLWLADFTYVRTQKGWSCLAVYIGWDNAHRLHRAFKGRTPLEVPEEYSQQQAAARATVAST